MPSSTGLIDAAAVEGIALVTAAIDHLQREANATAHEKGWYGPDVPERDFASHIALFHSELSEALAEWRHQHAVDEVYYECPKCHRISHEPAGVIHEQACGYTGRPEPEGVPIELADELIRIFDTCEELGIPLARALIEKMSFNRTRPHLHGGRRI